MSTSFGRVFVKFGKEEIRQKRDKSTLIFFPQDLKHWSKEAEREANRFKFKHKKKQVQALEPESRAPTPRGREWAKGDYVRITKAGSKFGQKAKVDNPNWEGRVQVIMEKDGALKSYLATELGPYNDGTQRDWAKGDYVRITKAGSKFGQKAKVENPNWEGRVQVIMEKDGALKSYLATELGPYNSEPHSFGSNDVFGEVLDNWMAKHTPGEKRAFRIAAHWLEKTRRNSQERLSKQQGVVSATAPSGP